MDLPMIWEKTLIFGIYEILAAAITITTTHCGDDSLSFVGFLLEAVSQTLDVLHASVSWSQHKPVLVITVPT